MTAPQFARLNTWKTPEKRDCFIMKQSLNCTKYYTMLYLTCKLLIYKVFSTSGFSVNP